jgi:hypothetical protein
MSFPLNELTRLIVPNRAVLGVVVGLNGDLVRVATEQGAVMAQSLDTLTQGDRVVIRNGIASRAPIARLRFPV